MDSKTGQSHAYQILLDNPQALPPMSSMAAAISRHGAVASVQLQHCGMYSHLVYERGGAFLPGRYGDLCSRAEAKDGRGHRPEKMCSGVLYGRRLRRRAERPYGYQGGIQRGKRYRQALNT